MHACHSNVGTPSFLKLFTFTPFFTTLWVLFIRSIHLYTVYCSVFVDFLFTQNSGQVDQKAFLSIRQLHHVLSAHHQLSIGKNFASYLLTNFWWSFGLDLLTQFANFYSFKIWKNVAYKFL